MTYANPKPPQFSTQDTTALGLDELQHILDAIDASDLVDRLQAYRWTGRRGYPLEGMLRAYLTSYALNIGNTSELVRRLQDDPRLRLLCGIPTVPHRTTFSRFFSRLTNHQGLIRDAIAGLTTQMEQLLPDFGEAVAVDSSVVTAYANKRRQTDADASWTKKPNSDGEDEWYYGYKLHMAVDAAHGLPIAAHVTTASRSDSPELPALLDAAAETHGWFGPKYVLADRGYDAASNHAAALSYGAEAIIPVRESPGGALKEGIYTVEGVPTCLGGQVMEYVRSDPERGHMYRCPAEGCHFKTRKGVAYCQDEVWENRDDNLRLFGPTRRGSPEWKALYDKRQSVERAFKSLKQSRRLNDHCMMGLAKVGLHALLSVLVYQATSLVRIMTGESHMMRWQVRKVA